MPQAIRIEDFDIWRQGYAGAEVTIYNAGTTTLADVFLDVDLTTPADNPQTLATRTDTAGITYGRWNAPLYIGNAYQMQINITGERTGVVRIPLYTLVDEDASEAVVTPTGGTEARDLADIAGDVIRVESFGVLNNTSPSGNATIIADAIGYAAGNGGGVVMVPPGTWDFTTLDVPEGVVLTGAGRGATILRSTQGQRIVTLAGDRAGLASLTLDGVSLAASSVGVYSVGSDEITLRDVEIKRFETGMQVKGSLRPGFRDLYIANCVTGADLRGDTDAGNSGDGGPLRSLGWDGGKVSLCSTAGVILSFEDDFAEGMRLSGVDFDTNSGTALRLNGARYVSIRGGRFSGNTVNLGVADDSDTSRDADNTVRSLIIAGASFDGGQLQFDGTCEDVILDLCDFVDADFVLSIPDAPILLIDSHEDSATTATGATEKLQRSSRSERGTFAGVTTDGNPITAWSLVPDPGEVFMVEAKAIGRQRNGVNYFSKTVRATGIRAGATLGFDLASGTLAVADVITGATSGASARIVANTQVGAAGTLTLRDITGDFEVGETLNTSGGENAKCVAGLNTPTTTVDGVDEIGTTVETDAAWDMTIDASSPQVRVRVTGNASQTIEWVVQVDVMRP